MSGFSRDDRGRAAISGAPLSTLLDESAISTPAYVYDLDAIEAEAKAMVTALGSPRHLVAYAIKANSAASIIRRVASTGAGAEVVSGGELGLVLRVPVPPNRVIMTAVAKKDSELDLAIASGLRSIQMESVEELARVEARAAAAGVVVPISFRVNPGVTVDTHAHVSTGHEGAKFGIPVADLGAAWERADRSPHLKVVGVGGHVGSTLKVVDEYLASARVMCGVARARLAAGGTLEFVDFGGGFNIDYGAGPMPPPSAFLSAAVRLLAAEGLDHLGIVVEPGRSMVAPHGVIVASVVQEKQTTARRADGTTQVFRWAFIDAAMNDLIRPALYSARHRIEPLDTPPAEPLWRVAGPVCESADTFGEHALGAHGDRAPDRVVIRDTGAYGFVMASEYNGRPLAAEVFVSGGRVVHVHESPGPHAWVKSRLDA